jgi:hypothetical protein
LLLWAQRTSSVPPNPSARFLVCTVAIAPIVHTSAKTIWKALIEALAAVFAKIQLYKHKPSKRWQLFQELSGIAVREMAFDRQDAFCDTVQHGFLETIRGWNFDRPEKQHSQLAQPVVKHCSDFTKY